MQDVGFEAQDAGVSKLKRQPEQLQSAVEVRPN